ncbi:IS21 family transposase [Mycobacterium dioxanotrophicus]|uniref:IS21 family transposase n=1 Tax=Mycobacterium dioxanotrophicus TaxID=482462 RepID=UPI001E4153DD|nr:IS21 family transposase [Mycobacterium dioxanotrophicus]
MIDPFVEYCRIRLADDPHLWASTLFDELVELGFTGSYPSLTLAIRNLGCDRIASRVSRSRAATSRSSIIRPGSRLSGTGSSCPIHQHRGRLTGMPTCWSGRWPIRAAGAGAGPAEDFAHVVEAIEAVSIRLGGVTQRWRFDRMATVCHPESGRITAAFAGVAKHYAVAVDVCPPRRGNRKGVVEKSNHAAAQRWWRTVTDDTTIEQAQASLDRLCVKLDGRRRRRDGQATTVGALADAEPLRSLPTGSYPAELTEHRIVTPQALVSWRAISTRCRRAGRATVTVTHRLGSDTVQLTTASGAVVAAHRRAVDGSGAVVRDAGHVVALEQAVLSGSRRPGLALIRPGDRPRWPPLPRPRGCVVPRRTIPPEGSDRSGRLCGDRSTAIRCSQHHPTEQNQE